MTASPPRGANHVKRRRRRSRLAAAVVGAGILVSTGHPLAAADTDGPVSPGNYSSHSGSTTGSRPTAPSKRGAHRTATMTVEPRNTDGGSAVKPASSVDSRVGRPRTPFVVPRHSTASGLAPGPVTQRSTPSAASPSSSTDLGAVASSGSPAALTTPTPNGTTGPPAPGSLSPAARIAALPGRIVNAVLQVLNLTSTAGGPASPLNFAPVNEMVFAAFRRLEKALGLSESPAVQPVLSSETYAGTTTAPTPTVAQFLNAATAEYVLGATPGGLLPFTVNCAQMTSTKYLSGESARAWVTPQQQIVIAYQGTTGGTNLLFHPLITIPQLIADMVAGQTDTTPRAFTDSVTFARAVLAAALQQGYSAGDVFVTGHSLGAWEAEYVAQQTGLGGIGFESPGLSTVVPGNGAASGFVNIETYGDPAAYTSTDLPGLQPYVPAYVPGGGSKPHYGSIVMIGDPNATTPLINASANWGRNLLANVILAVEFLGNFAAHHPPGIQAHYLDVIPDPGLLPWLGSASGPVDTGYGNLTIPQLKQAASQSGTLITP